MNPHDIASMNDEFAEGFQVWVYCACGASFVAATEEGAKRKHSDHFGLMQARAALRGEKEHDGA